MKRVSALGATLALLLAPLLVRLLKAQSPSAPPPPPPTYTLTDLGSLNGASWIDQENVRRGPTALNANAQVAGFRLNLAFGDQPIGFLWDKGTFTDLGTGGGPQSYAYGINDASQIVGASNFVASSNFPGDLTGNSSRAFIWQNGVMTILDPDPNNWSRAYAINKGGDVAGFIATGGTFPAIWRAGSGRTVLPSLPCSLASCQGEALAINDIGQAAGVSVGGNVNAFRPVMWDSNGQPTDLIPEPGDPGSSEANGINNNGAVIGYYQPQPSINNLLHAFRWQGGVFTDLGTIGTDTYSGAWGIDSKGNIVGTSATTFSPILGGDGGRAFLYIAATQTMYDLTTLVPGTNWRLNAGYAINDNGQIVGIGIAPDGSVHGFLLTPVITPTTATVATSVNPSVFGQQVSFTATVTPTQSSSLTPTGNVTFNDGTTVLGTVTLSSGTAVFNTAALGPGTHTISASYGGDNNFGSSTSSGVNQAVNQAATSTTMMASPNRANLGQAVMFTATVSVVAPGAGSPTGTVSFRDGATALGTVVLNSAGNATFSTSSLVVGSHSITAVYGGDTNFAGGSSSSVNQVISQPATSTALAASPNPANLGQTVTFTATVTVVGPGVGTPTGTVTFLDGSTTLGIGVLSSAGTATFSTSSLGVGSHTVTASYGGDATFAGSTSTGVIVAVQGVAQVMVNETVHVTDAESFPDVFDAEGVNVTDAVTVTPLINLTAPVAQFSAGSLGFSGQSGSQTITVSDIGKASLTLSSATVSGSSQFTITQIACSNSATSFSTMLPSGGACVVTIGYSASATPANDNGTLVFTDDAALSNVVSSPAGSSYTQSIPLSGSGATTGPPPPPPAVIPVMDNETIHVTDTSSFPDVFDAEAVHVADTVFVTPLIQVAAPVAEFSAGSLGFSGQSGSQTITVSDIGTASLSIASATISGSPQFTITQIACSNSATSFSTMLPSGGACVVTIGYSASATPANDNGILIFTDNAALSNVVSSPAGSSYTQSISLSGSGTTTGPPPPPPAVITIPPILETIKVTDTPSFPDVSDSEHISVTDQVSIQVLNSTTTSITITGGTVYGTTTSVIVSVSSPTAAVSGSVTLSVDGGAATTLSLTNGSATFNLRNLSVGQHALAANFPAQGNFLGSSAATKFAVAQATPTITWANPPAITYGTALSGKQLNATASVPGTLVYNPPAGTVLRAGSQTLSVSFAPNDTIDYTKASASVTLVVNKATPIITWPNPAPIVLGTPLSSTQLNATASVSGVSLPGTFVYNPPLKTVLGAGTQTLSVTFTPTDTTDYQSVTQTVSITVNVTGNLSVQPGQTYTFNNGSISGNVTLSGGTLTLIGSSVGGSLTMSSGSLTLDGNSTVSNNVQIQGGSFSIKQASIKGNLQITNVPAGKAPGVVCGASVSGDLQFQYNAIPGQIGPSSCLGNKIGGNLMISNNTAPLQIFNNAVGGNLQVQSNTGSAQIFQNTVQNVLQCSGNSSPFTGGQNTAVSKQGQCASF